MINLYLNHTGGKRVALLRTGFSFTTGYGSDVSKFSNPWPMGCMSLSGFSGIVVSIVLLLDVLEVLEVDALSKTFFGEEF